MRIACIGGGPAGLVFAISMKLRDPAHDIVVFERNDPGDTLVWSAFTGCRGVCDDAESFGVVWDTDWQRCDEHSAFASLARANGN